MSRRIRDRARRAEESEKWFKGHPLNSKCNYCSLYKCLFRPIARLAQITPLPLAHNASIYPYCFLSTSSASSSDVYVRTYMHARTYVRTARSREALPLSHVTTPITSIDLDLLRKNIEI